MITGFYTSDQEARIRLTVDGPAGQREVEVAVDTGFTGFLTLPPEIIVALDLPWRGSSHVMLGDGSLHLLDVHEALVMWDGEDRAIEVDASETDPLVGMSLIHGHELRIEAIDGGTVTIETLRLM